MNTTRNPFRVGYWHWGLVAVLLMAGSQPAAQAQSDSVDTSRGDRMIAEYFRIETEKLRDRCLAEIKTVEDWKTRRDAYRRELLEMLGLEPLPPRTDLKATVTGTTEHDEFKVERIHFQSRPGLYVTGDLYLPRESSGPLPAILYVCGHGGVKKNGVSYGNKVHYQHHGAWFARNGYACLTIDTLQLGEIEGIHHGTYREKMWWWLNRGYTPAGVEAWNCVRALDYLETRPEIDAKRFGVTGRSGGGAYSWWIAAIDERIKCAVPVAGITDLQNHVYDGNSQRFPDGCVEGHCDCMYMLNTYRWDYSKVAAMVAPRALLISNTDTDTIFPLDGVYRVFEDARRIYRLHGEGDQVALNITAGGHQDTQELRVHAFRWFNKHLKNDTSLIEKTAVKFFEPEQLKVFGDKLPADQLNSEIHETFVAAARPALPADAEQWERMKTGWRSALKSKSFAAWPQEGGPLDVQEVFSATRKGMVLRAIDFTSQPGIRLRLYIAHHEQLADPRLVVLNPVSEEGWNDFLSTMRPAFEQELQDERLPAGSQREFASQLQLLRTLNMAMAWVAPRGIGPTKWNQSERKQTQHRRRFYLLGQTLDGMRVYDVLRSIETLRTAGGMKEVPLWLQSQGSMAGVTLYASLFADDIKRLDLYELSATHRYGPFFLNVNRYLDISQAVAMAAERSDVMIYQSEPVGWEYPRTVAKSLGWERKFQIREVDERNTD